MAKIEIFLTNCHLADHRLADIGFRRDDSVEVAFDLVGAAGAQALGLGDYGVTVGAAANLFSIAASCVAEAVAAHPPRKLVLFNGKIVARDGIFTAALTAIANEATA